MYETTPRGTGAAMIPKHAAVAALSLAVAIQSMASASADEVVCTTAAAYADRIQASRKLSLDDKGCISHELGRLTMRICTADPPGSRIIDASIRGAGVSAGIKAMHVLEWSSSLELKDQQGFGFNLSGLLLLGADEAVSVRYTDFWRDDPNVSNARQTPADRVDMAQGTAGPIVCAGGKPDIGALMGVVQQLHRPKPASPQKQ